MNDTPSAAPQDLARASAAELGRLYRTRAASPVETMQAVLARAETVNPKLNALTIVDAEGALAAARASEARWAAGQPRSPLDGAPVTVKELVRVKGWPHSMGSRLADKSPAADDAPSVARLREAGAIVWSQNASPEYGHKGVTDSPLRGITRNPWNLERTPGGSSGGTGAAVAASLGPLGIGTDGGGSVRIPAAFTGLVGLKATYGRVPAWPPSMHGDLANVGPMTRTVADCALMLNEMTKPDPRDPFTAPPDARDWTAGLGAGVKGLKVGLVSAEGRAFVEPPIAERLAAAAGTLEQLGAVVIPIEPPPESAEAGRVWVTHWFSAMQRLLQIYPAERHGELDPSLLAQARTGEGYTVQALVDAMVERRTLTTAWNLVFATVDLVIMPTLNVLPFPVGQGQPLGLDGKPNQAWANTSLFNLTRHPAISVPLPPSDDGLPIGLQIAAAHYRDDLVLAAAAALEAAHGLVFPDLPR
ncbi:MAG TPA: amidase family protein [Caulobacteraceae bacterium]|jgi:aspartyl-tRNA(Asn)/glutamyl-tRNA(Gln) amidotransferase subunit A